MGPHGGVNQAVLDRVIRRVVEVAQPEKIILFGSAARGRMGPHSDLDLLVVRGGVRSACELAGRDLPETCVGVGVAVDVIVVISGTIWNATGDSLRHDHSSKPALREGSGGL